MMYELIDRTSGNFAGVYETEREALRDVAITIAMYGDDEINDLILGSVDDTGLKRFLIAKKAFQNSRRLATPCPAGGGTAANEAAEHRRGGCEIHEACGAGGRDLVVAGQPSIARQPRERTLDDPPAR